MDITNESRLTRSQFVLIIITLSIGLIFASMILKDQTDYLASVEGELSIVKSTLSKSEWDAVNEKTIERYQRLFIDSGIYEFIRKSFEPKTEGVAVAVLEETIVNSKWNVRFLENIQVFTYQVFHRYTMFEFWIMTLIPLVMAIIWTGVNEFRAKSYRVGGVSANLTRLYLKVVWLFILLFILYLFLPNYIGSFAAYLPAGMLIMLSMAIMGIIQSFHKG